MGGPGAGADALDPAVELLLEGDETAFREVYRAVHPPLLRYLSMLVGPHDAEDVASEAWGQAFRDLSRFSGGADDFRAWLTTIGRNRAMDHLRRQGRRIQPEFGLGAAEYVADGIDVADTVVNLESTQGVLAILADLPPDQAEAILLRAVLGFDAKTAGRILGKRAGAVRSAAHRGLKTLADRLDGEGRPRETASGLDHFNWA